MTTLNVPNNLTNGTTADATDVQQNFDSVESHVNTELVNRDGSIAMTGELLLPSNPTSNLGAATKSYVDTQVGNEESARIAAVSSEATTRASADTALDNRVTALEGTDIAVTLTGNVTGSGTITNLGNVSIATTVDTEVVQDIVGAMVSGNTESGISVTYDDVGNSLDFNVNDPTITLTGDVTGSATMTNLGNVSITTVVADDSHNHVVGNIDSFTENVQDIVGGMVSSNTESGIEVTYDDTNGKLNFETTVGTALIHSQIGYTNPSGYWTLRAYKLGDLVILFGTVQVAFSSGSTSTLLTTLSSGYKPLLRYRCSAFSVVSSGNTGTGFIEIESNGNVNAVFQSSFSVTTNVGILAVYPGY